MLNSSLRLTKNLSKFRLVTFDVTDTLLRFREPPAIQYTKIASKYGYNITEKEISDIFHTEFKYMSKNYPNYGRDSNIEWQDWWKTLIFNTFLATSARIPENDLENLSNELIDLFRTETGNCWLKTNGADDIIDKFKMLNKTIGIISNFDPSLHKVIQFMKFPEFKFILTSYEIGVMKPNSEIFHKALELSGNDIKNGEALHIGNSIELDYLGALNAGWSSLLIIDPNDQKSFLSKENNTSINKKHVFTSLEEALESLETAEFTW